MTRSTETTAAIPVDADEIHRILGIHRVHDASRVREILARSLDLKGLPLEDVAVLANVSDPVLLGEMFEAARCVKQRIYGNRLVIFAPLYVSNLCANECTYCAFRTRNTQIRRRALTQEEIAEETLVLVRQGHKRVLLVAGESYPNEGFNYVLKSIATVYATREGKGEIRRINVNVAPLGVEEFRQLKDAGIGTYQLFQETYHRETYARLHLSGPKRDYDWRVTAMHRAMEAGLGDVGVGVLFGLFDWRFDLLALLQHARYLEQHFGVGPHTMSVPRLEPASGSDLASQPPYPVSDVDFRKIVAILRLAVPYTGIIMSTRETPNIRRETFSLGVSQISAGSRTNPGGYTEEKRGEGISSADPDACRRAASSELGSATRESQCAEGGQDARPPRGDAGNAEAGNGEAGSDDAGHGEAGGQFSLGDHRPLDEVVRQLAELGYIPSFCTACYRLGRTGQDFMDLAKPGEIRHHCDPNALSTFMEYLLDYATPATMQAGTRLVDRVLTEMEPTQREISSRLLEAVRAGQRDVFV